MIDVGGVRNGPAVRDKARIEAIMPVTSRDRSSISAEFLAGEGRRAGSWDESLTEKHADSAGRHSSYRCSLAAPVTLPVSVRVLNVDTSAMEHGWFVTALSLSNMKLDWVHSRSGPVSQKWQFLLLK